MDDNYLTKEDKEFLAKCEEELKDRYTVKDEEFMKVFNRPASVPPILEKWWMPFNGGRRNDRRFNRRHHPYDRYGNRDNQGRSNSDNRGNNDYNNSYRSHSRYSQY